MDMQSLFDTYNQQYFGGRLPRYKVLHTDKYNGGRCERRKRTIYINPHTGDISLILLHEMAHAAVGYGHGKVWLDEIKRLVELGAPLQEELKLCAPETAITPKQILPEFFQAGLEAPDNWTWPEVRRYLGYMYGLTDKNGRAENSRCSLFLRKARREWLRGRALACPGS